MKMFSRKAKQYVLFVNKKGDDVEIPLRNRSDAQTTCAILRYQGIAAIVLDSDGNWMWM